MVFTNGCLRSSRRPRGMGSMAVLRKQWSPVRTGYEMEIPTSKATARDSGEGCIGWGGAQGRVPRGFAHALVCKSEASTPQ